MDTHDIPHLAQVSRSPSTWVRGAAWIFGLLTQRTVGIDAAVVLRHVRRDEAGRYVMADVVESARTDPRVTTPSSASPLRRTAAGWKRVRTPEVLAPRE